MIERYEQGKLQFGRGGNYNNETDQYDEWILQLPHRCGEWNIGRKEDAARMIVDLQKALECWPDRAPRDTYEIVYLDGRSSEDELD